jgi:hypothetical protein
MFANKQRAQMVCEGSIPSVLLIKFKQIGDGLPSKTL